MPGTTFLYFWLIIFMALPKKQLKDQEDRKIFEGVFDDLAIKDLFKMKAKHVFDIYKGMWKEGKESRIFLAYNEREQKDVLIKIYKVEASNFKSMRQYIVGDPRFKGIKDNKRSVVYGWCKKEHHNLELARSAGLDAPKPLYYIHNIIAMDLITLDDKKGVPAPQLKEAYIDEESARIIFNKIIKDIYTLYNKAGLVHGDVSEYNILLPKEHNPVIIDYGQAVVKAHPLSLDLLKRDITNVVNYFSKHYGIKEDKKEIFKKIVNKERI